MRLQSDWGGLGRWHRLRLATLGFFAAAGLAAQPAQAVVLFSENFDSLPLLGSVNERLGPGNVTRIATDPDSVPFPNSIKDFGPSFSRTGPAGWEVDNALSQFDGVPSLGYFPSPTIGNAGVPGAGLSDYGVNEWEGWSFANKAFWVDVAGDQNRSQFTSGIGTVAVVDPDEYFDLGDSDHPVNGGYYNSSLKSPTIGIVGENFYTLTFDSSWRPEAFDDTYGPDPSLNSTNNQAVEILAVFDNGFTQVIDGWNSDSSSPHYKPDATNEAGRQASFLAPAGANSVRLHFNMANAANDWWWAIDNLKLENLNTVSQVWSEDFESAPLGPSENERLAFTAKQTVAEATPNTQSRPDSFTNVPPAGWNIDNSGLPAGTLGNNDIGVYEWEGWSFATREFWNFADLQRRQEFTKCVANCAIADSDEWTDLGASSNFGPMNTVLITPAIDISGIGEGNLRLSFDSSWRPEGNQVAEITVDFNDGNGPQPVMLWTSDPASPDFHGDATNESILDLIVNNPASASTATFRFAHLGGNNNWWWAIDNIVVSAVPEPTSFGLLLGAIGVGAISARKR